MTDFLVDGNHVSALFNKETKVVEKLRTTPAERLFFFSKIIRGELEGGHRLTAGADPQKITEFWEFVDQQFTAIDPIDDTSRRYGEILERIHQKYPKKTGTKVENWLIQHGVQTNDVWFVAEAWSHNLICLTSDGMEKIKEAVNGNVRFENWR